MGGGQGGHRLHTGAGGGVSGRICHLRLHRRGAVYRDRTDRPHLRLPEDGNVPPGASLVQFLPFQLLHQRHQLPRGEGATLH